MKKLLIYTSATVLIFSIAFAENKLLETPFAQISDQQVNNMRLLLEQNIKDVDALNRTLFATLTQNLFNSYINELFKNIGKNIDIEALTREKQHRKIQEISTEEETKKAKTIATTLLDYICSSSLTIEQYYQQKIENSEIKKVFPDLNYFKVLVETSRNNQNLLKSLSELSKCNNANELKLYLKKFDLLRKESSLTAFVEFLSKKLVEDLKIDEDKLHILDTKTKIYGNSYDEKLKNAGKSLIWIAFFKDLKDSLVIYDTEFEKNYKEYLRDSLLHYEEIFSQVDINIQKIDTKHLLQLIRD